MSIDLYSYPACLGTVVVDWKERTISFAGMDGCGCGDMTAEEVQETLAKHADDPDVEAMALIFWMENEQLAVHDAGSFEDELERDRELKDEDEEEEENEEADNAT